MTKPIRPTDHTAAEWRALATRHAAEGSESFDRCDTDGFLSQWASGRLSLEYLRVADIAEDGGFHEFQGLTDLEGNLLDARYVETRYGWAWAINNPNGSTSWFNESEAKSGKRRRTAHEKKGYRIVSVKRPAVVWPGGRISPDAYSDVKPVITGEIDYPDY